MDTLPPFARVIREQRERRGMSRSQLAEASGLSYPYISQLETGLRKPSRSAAGFIAQALQLELDDLERTIPADDQALNVKRAEDFSARLLSGSVSGDVIAGGTSSPHASGHPGSRADIIADIIDLLEEFEPSERLDVLADVQRLAMQRMLDRS